MDFTRVTHLLTDKGIAFSENRPLSEFTSFHIGGPAALMVFPGSVDEAAAALTILREESCERVTVLGNGTNLLAADEGYDGAVVVLSGMKNITFADGLLRADAGVSVTALSGKAAKLSLTGLEFAYGIPGTVGGGIYMNAGAYGGEMAQVVAASRWYDLDTGEVGVTVGDAHGFSYRRSCYMGSRRVVFSADFRLEPGNAEEITARMNDYMSRRREKQPLEYPSAGSVFKRGNGFITAKLIEEAGLKGRSVGGAQVSEKHAGFIVNRGGARAADVLALIGIIKSTVKEKFGAEIECEVRYLR
ncbi:MAG: UDP-N-acetylmuramate dehydrogenase [Clostridia bacterium]|nr:UDP-N-acetylmuramate dehydrogenase [Clostridia bacterium]